MLGCGVAVGAAHHEAPVATTSAQRGPHLLAVDHPLVAVELGPGLRRWPGRSRRRARSSPGTRSRRRDRMPGRNRCCCSSVPKCDQRRAEQALADVAHAGPAAGPGVLLVEDHLLRERQAAPAVLGRPADAGPTLAPRCCSQASRSSTTPPSSPGPPRPRTTANSPASVVSSQSRISARKATSSAEKRRSTARSVGELGIRRRSGRLTAASSSDSGARARRGC